MISVKNNKTVFSKLTQKICPSVSAKQASKQVDPCFPLSDFQIFFNWDLLHAWVNSHYKAWSYKKKKHKKIKAYRKSV